MRQINTKKDMNNAHHHWLWLIPGLILFLLLVSCQPPGMKGKGAKPEGMDLPTATYSATWKPAASQTPVPTVIDWEHYPTPLMTSVTEVPPYMTGIDKPDDVKVLVLLRTDKDTPYVGRTDAVMLVFAPLTD